MTLFDTALIAQRQQRYAQHWPKHHFLHKEMAERLAERLADVRVPLHHGRIDGDRHGVLRDALASSPIAWQSVAPHDVILNFATLQQTNDVVGALIQARQALRPDGLLMAVFVGGESLREMRECLHTTEQQLYGGVSPRVHPMISVRDAGGLLQRAGFALPVADVDTLTLTYEHPMTLLRDVRHIGAANALVERHRRPLSKRFWQHFSAVYAKQYPHDNDTVKATIQLIFLTAWAPAVSQPQPLQRGSGQQSLKDVL